MRLGLGRFLIPALAVFTLMPFINAGVALLLGIAASLAFGNPYQSKTSAITKKLLSISVIGLGAGMNLISVAKVGLHGFGYTVIGITCVMAAGWLIAKLLKTERETSVLIAVGTAICGGSAIAAVAPVMDAKAHSITIAMGVVFLLNALALLLFPAAGHYFGLTQEQFGLWSALAIHDTSSVVGAASQYGPQALEVGTTVKLARALWIIPMVFAVQALHNRYLQSADGHSPNTGRAKPKYPWFILGFLTMAAIVTFSPSLQEVGQDVAFVAKRLLVLTLFLIGASLTRETLRGVGVKPLLFGVALWALVTAGTLLALKAGFLSF